MERRLKEEDKREKKEDKENVFKLKEIFCSAKKQVKILTKKMYPINQVKNQKNSQEVINLNQF